MGNSWTYPADTQQCPWPRNTGLLILINYIVIALSYTILCHRISSYYLILNLLYKRHLSANPQRFSHQYKCFLKPANVKQHKLQQFRFSLDTFYSPHVTKVTMFVGGCWWYPIADTRSTPFSKQLIAGAAVPWSSTAMLAELPRHSGGEIPLGHRFLTTGLVLALLI